ncbi:MAG: MotA/TolQ/ExbB proton channel family protein [Pseudomonadota bacterium]
MRLTEGFLSLALIGADWVIWLLAALSVVSVAIMIERFCFFAGCRVDTDRLISDLRNALGSGKPENALEAYRSSNALEAVVGLAGLEEAARGPEAAAEAMLGARSRQRLKLERNLVFLGTLGNNAPFIGLFGTVLGIIKAFHDLAEDTQAGTQAVMAGISEALVATAVGLLVALPAVVMFNYFQRRVRASVLRGEAVSRFLLSKIRGNAADLRMGQSEPAPIPPPKTEVK